jgi:hypothetical protein
MGNLFCQNMASRTGVRRLHLGQAILSSEDGDDTQLQGRILKDLECLALLATNCMIRSNTKRSDGSDGFVNLSCYGGCNHRFAKYSL